MGKIAPLEPGRYYHVYSRGNNREDIFPEERNYAYFLKLYALHVEPVAETFAYCLMRNHFHVLVRVRDPQNLTANLAGLGDLPGLGTRFDPAGDMSRLASRHFSNLFNAYAKAINKAYGRTGALFESPFGRIEVGSDAYLSRLVVYIHRNPQKHRFVADYREWPHSSYPSLLAAQPTRLQRAQVLEWFGGAGGLAAAHEDDSADAEPLDLAPGDFD